MSDVLLREFYMSARVYKAKYVVGMKVTATSYAHTIDAVIAWANARQSRYICISNVHMAMECHNSASFKRVVNEADLVTPDGMPLVWMMRWLGVDDQQRVRGPSLLPLLCEAAALHNLKVGFYGSTDLVLQQLVERLHRDFPKLEVAFSYSPPFRALSATEDDDIINNINSSGANILFVGLGCPKQEIWMAQHSGQIMMPMLGVGAAFDICSGIKSESPLWLQKLGLEWIYRFILEPRRLWKRYLKHNPHFVWLALVQLISRKERKSDS